MDTDKQHPAGGADGGDGCLVGVIRVPVKIVAVLVVLPVRVVWELLVALGRALHRHVLGPLYAHVVEPVFRAVGWLLGTVLKLVFVWPWVGLWRYVLVPVGRFLGGHVFRPLGEALAWVGRAGVTYLLAPLAKGGMWCGWALGMALFVWPWVALWRYVLVPVGQGIGWMAAVVYRYTLTPVGQGLVWLVGAVYRYVLTPVGRGFVWLVGAVYRYVLTPLGQGLVWLVVALFRYGLRPVGLGVAWLVVALWRYGLRPVGIAVGWVADVLYRYVLTPLGQVLAWAWHVAGTIAGALWRGLKWAGWVLVGWPASWAYRHVLTPVGHTAREVWRTGREAVREARAAVRQALFGTPPREPARSRARTLGSTTAADAAPAAEISLSKRQG
ncbi:hypothetical protein [Streptomyces sp. NPDC059072]|uniref:hypothetical protein n=1 Tax=Streptomyces sp. NPDC059072 TaxID=3346715 RepID=UPI00367D9F3C